MLWDGATRLGTAFDSMRHDPLRNFERACSGPAAVRRPQACCDLEGHRVAGKAAVAAGVAPCGGGFAAHLPKPEAETSNAERCRVYWWWQKRKLTVKQRLADFHAISQGGCGMVAHPVYKWSWVLLAAAWQPGATHSS